MAVLQDTLELERGGAAGALAPGQPAADAILHLLAHMAHSDGELHERELDLLAGILPGRSRGAIQRWIEQVGAEPPRLEQVAAVLDSDDLRWTCLRFTARMAWRDDRLQDEERAFLDTLAATLGLPPFAVDRVLREMQPDTQRFTTARIIEVLQSVRWTAVRLASGPVVSAELLAVAPRDAACVCRVGVDKVEVLALYESGIAGRFLEGPHFLTWSEIVSYERGFAIGTAVKLVTEDGGAFRLVDARLGGLCMVLDLLLGGGERRPGQAPDVLTLRGE